MKKNEFFKNYNSLKKKKFKNFTSFLKIRGEHEYKIYLNLLSRILNDYHKLNLSSKKWNYIIGPWLKWILDSYNFKKMLVKNIKFFKNFFVNRKFIEINVPKDFSELIDNSNSDLFNRSIFLHLLYGESNYNFRKKKNYFSFKNIISLFYILIFRVFNILKINKSLIIFDNKKKNKIFQYKDSHIYYPYSNLRNLSFFSKDFSSREKLIFSLKKKNFFNKKLIFLIANIPIDYFENFNNIRFISKFIISGKKFYSRVSHWDNEYFKNYLAFNQNNSVYLDQHGGNYSFVNKNLYYAYDKHISEKTFWWDKFNNKKLNSKFFSIRLSEIYSKRQDFNIKYDACYIQSYLKKYDYQNEFYDNFDYDFKIKQLKNFYKYSKYTNVVIKIPPKRYNSQVNTSDLKKIGFKRKQIKSENSTFFKSKILVFEHISTAIFETRVKNIPFIIILDNKNYFLSKEGRSIFNIMKKENILFSNGRDAAIYLNKINNINKWWNKKKRTLNSIFYM